jgi:HEAT repeat protein
MHASPLSYLAQVSRSIANFIPKVVKNNKSTTVALIALSGLLVFSQIKSFRKMYNSFHMKRNAQMLNKLLEPHLSRFPKDYVRTILIPKILKLDRPYDFLMIMKESKDKEIIKFVIRALGDLGNEKSLNALVEMAEDEDPQIRVAVFEALGEKKTDDAFQLLLKMTGNAHIIVRCAAIKGLGKISHDKDFNKKASAVLLDMTYSPFTEVLYSLAEALGEIKTDESVNALIEMTKDVDLKLRSAAALSLGKMETTTAFNTLMNMKEDSEAIVRAAVAEAFGEVKTDESLDALIEMTKDACPEVQRAVIKTLGKTNSDKAFDALVKMKSSKDREIVAHVIAALGEMTCNTDYTERVFNILLGTLNDDDPWLRGIRGLGKIGRNRAYSDRACDALMKVEGSEGAIAIALGNIASSRVYSLLKKMKKNQSKIVQCLVEDSILKIELEFFLKNLEA